MSKNKPHKYNKQHNHFEESEIHKQIRNISYVLYVISKISSFNKVPQEIRSILDTLRSKYSWCYILLTINRNAVILHIIFWVTLRREVGDRPINVLCRWEGPKTMKNVITQIMYIPYIQCSHIKPIVLNLSPPSVRMLMQSSSSRSSV